MDKPKTTSTNTSGQREESYWEFVERIAAKVDNYPAWKVGGSVDSARQAATQPRRVKTSGR